MALTTLVFHAGCFGSKNTAASAEYARQVTTANMRVAQMENTLADAQTRVEQLEEYVRLQGQTAANRLENLDQVNAEVSRLRGQIEVMQFELSAIKEDLSAYQLGQERRQLHDESRLSQLEDFLGVSPPPPPTNADLGLPPAEGEEPVDPVPTGDDPDVEVPPEDASARAKLDAAAGHMAEARPKVAQQILIKAAQVHADDPEIEEIKYRLAEAHLAQRNYGKAALAFKGVIDDHPKSPWASWSMLRQGDCFKGLGQADNARLFYDGVIQRYPKSEAAKEASAKLGR